jgi:tetratricopeptide (TPR) repeat protein
MSVVENQTPRDSSKFEKGLKGIPFWHLVAFGLIVITAFLAYSNSFHVPFQFDDRPNLVNNRDVQIRDLTWDRLDLLVKKSYQDNIRVFSYLTFALNYHFGGLNVFGYHLVNVVIHIGSGIFLYWLLVLTFNLPSLRETYGSISYRVSLFTSLIFISHPIQTQSVTYIVQRMASMAGMFYLLSMVLYVKGRSSWSKSRFICWGGSAFSWVLGLFSKENVAILPIFVLLYEIYFFQNSEVRKRGKRILGLLIGSIGLIAFVGLLVWGERYFHQLVEGYKIREFTLSERILTQFRVVLYYVSLLVYPHPSRLNLDYDFPLSKTMLDPPTTLISILIILGLIGLSFWKGKKSPILSFCILWYFGNLVIESSIFPLEMVYEHRLYLPSVGPFLLFSLLTVRGIEELKIGFFRKAHRSAQGINVIKPADKFVEWFIPLGVILLLSIWTYQRNSIWNSELELWKDCVKKSPQKERVHHNLGFVYYEMERLDDAEKEFEQALRLNPRYALSLYNLGLVYYRKGSMDEAIRYYQKAIGLDSKSPDFFYNLGIAYYQKGLYEKAIQVYQKVLELNPDYENGHNSVGLVYEKSKQWDKAIQSFQEELGRHPGNVYTHLYLGDVYMEKKEYSKALAHFRKALEFPKLPDAERVRKLISSIEMSPKNR